VIASPSVSIRATSTPSCEVPLISPIAKTGGGCEEDCAGKSAAKSAAMAAFPVESVAGPVTPAPPPRRAALFSMIRKSGYRFSEKIMLHQRACGTR
jgi:hypothetical protein